MQIGPPAYQRWLALILIAVGWFLFANLARATVNKIREFPDWSEFLVLSALENKSGSFSAGSQSFNSMQIVAPTVSSSQVFIPTNTPMQFQHQISTVIPTTEIHREQFAAPSCRYSGQSQFNEIGQYGEITRNVRMRSSPTSTSGTSIVSGTRFEIIGQSRCAVPTGYSAEMLFLNVRLVGISNDRIGWIPESGISGSGGVVYNVRPVR